MHPSNRKSHLRRLVLLASILLIVASLVTWGLRQAGIGHSEQQLEQRQELEVTRALDLIQVDFNRRRSQLESFAQRLAETEELASALAQRVDAPNEGERRLVEFAESMSLPARHAVEIYDPVPRLLAWNGFDMPLDEGPQDASFLVRPIVRMAHDGDKRAAMVAWFPVERDGRVVGVVRVMQALLVRMPVRNEYLRDASLDDDWSRDTGLEVTVDYAPREQATAGHQMALSRLDGTTLISVQVRPPSAAQLKSDSLDRYDAWLGAWLTMGVLLMLILVGRWALQSQRMVVWLIFAAAVSGGRYVLIVLGVPARWQGGKTPLAPLFDPTHLASPWGWGIAGSIGDLLLTGLFLGGIALVTVRILLTKQGMGERFHGRRRLVSGFAQAVSGFLLFAGVSGLALRVLQDSTLDFFGRSGLVPERLVVAVFASLLLTMFAAVVVQIAACRVLSAAQDELNEPVRYPGWLSRGITMLLVAAFALLAGWGAARIGGAVLFVAIASSAALGLPLNRRHPVELFALRPVLVAAVVLAIALYPILDTSLEDGRRSRIVDAAESYSQELDPRVLLAMDVVLREGERSLSRLLEEGAALDSALDALISRSLLTALGTYEVSASVLDDADSPTTRYAAARSAATAASIARRDRDDLALFKSMGASRERPTVERITSPVEQEAYDYVGVIGLSGGWLLVRASQHARMPSGSVPFPRVLVPSGYFGSRYPDLSVAEFRDGILTRTVGEAFGRSVLDAEVSTALQTQSRLWRNERIRDRRYSTLYVRQTDQEDWSDPSPRFRRDVVAVRQSAVSVFDRLYYLLRLTVSGLLIAIPVYLIGLVVRYRAGWLPAPKVHFRDRVLNAFLGVGLVAVATMGVLGLRVVTEENDRAVESWLRQHLNRVEYSLSRSAQGSEMAYRVLERVDIDSLAAEVGLDLNVYRGFELESSSRPQLVRDRLIGGRIPIEAYNRLFIEGFRFSTVEETLGRFEYTAGYRALTDEQGVPRYVVSVPTLPEQERLEEERARTVAYLFGALLLLLMVVMATAGVIANALALPVQRLRSGLASVAEGRFERVAELDTRDELGALVGSFNEMQDQLAESRTLLAQQERQLAWREMARQVAHEIKNPLTPMKLSVQHLRRAHGGRDPARFGEILGRISGTLIEQIDALARIADEFSSFARMPQPKIERLDLNTVVFEAVSLMQEHTQAELRMTLSENPLAILGDREALRRMYINFIKNALEALPQEKEGRIQVRTGTETDPGTGLVWALSEVEDNGTGIPDELKDRIFNPAFSTKTSGTGLGLAIAKSTVDALRGRIGFESTSEGGTIFWVRLPLEASVAEPV